jgi:hypothetical protein
LPKGNGFDAVFAAFQLKDYKGEAIVIPLRRRGHQQQVLVSACAGGGEDQRVLIHSIGLHFVLDVTSHSVLKELAEETGGRSFFPGKAEDLEGVYQQIPEELRKPVLLT